MLGMTPRSSLSSKVLLLRDAPASGGTGGAPLRRYRIARLPVGPRVTAAARIEQLKRPTH